MQTNILEGIHHIRLKDFVTEDGAEKIAMIFFNPAEFQLFKYAVWIQTTKLLRTANVIFTN